MTQDRPFDTSVPELLAPAGDREALLAALSAGADAVYLGAAAFNARRNAENFSAEGLAEACTLAHLAHRRVYLTLNTMIKPTEMQAALRLAHEAWELGVDALIVSDLGLIARLSRELPTCRLHASTQMNLHSTEALRAAATLGLSRVTLARELSLEELATIAAAGAACGVEVEVFAHGALCVCSSGQCLFSSMVGGRSANRGMCAQPCRLPYQLIDVSTGQVVPSPGEHLLSTADLATVDILPKLTASGIASLKIEGRMKSAVYVATVVQRYREALDRAASGAAGAASDAPSGAQRAGYSESAATPGGDLDEVFSRGFTTAYLTGERGNAMMSYRRPNNRGVLVGRVTAIRDGLVQIQTNRPLSRGDVLEIRTGRGQAIVELDEFESEASSVRLRVPAPVGRGDRVFRVRNAQLLNRTAEVAGKAAFAGNRGLVRLKARVRLRLGQPLELGFATVEQGLATVEQGAGATVEQGLATVEQGAGASVCVTGPIVEKARSRPMSEADVREHIGRVGGTPFSIVSWDVALDEGVGLGFSVLHALRAEALDMLSEELLRPWHKRTDSAGGTRSASTDAAALAPAHKGAPRIGALVSTESAAKVALEAGAAYVYLNALDERPDAKRAAGGTLSKVDACFLPAISHDRDLTGIKPSTALIANNLAQIALAQKGEVPFEAGPALGICNRDALDLLARMGATQAWLSPELSHSDIARLSPTASLSLALVIVGQQELMVTEHCLLMAQGPCDQRCASCKRRQVAHLLQDRKGYRFPVSTDRFGRGHLYNAVPLDLVPSMPKLVAAGISTLVVDGTLMDNATLKAEVRRAVRALTLAVHKNDSLPKREGCTTGHFYRGVQ
jgi:putative protease